MSDDAEQLQEALALYRQHETTDRRDEMYNHLRSVVESIRRKQESGARKDL
jgi:hypothetical protein